MLNNIKQEVVKIEVKSKELLRKSEITFEDEIIIDGDKVNAYIPLYYINVFEKFFIKEKENYEYNVYLEYYLKSHKCLISIIEKDDDNYIIYEYKPTDEESKMLREKLNQYCVQTENQTLKEIVNEEEFE